MTPSRLSLWHWNKSLNDLFRGRRLLGLALYDRNGSLNALKGCIEIVEDAISTFSFTAATSDTAMHRNNLALRLLSYFKRTGKRESIEKRLTAGYRP